MMRLLTTLTVLALSLCVTSLSTPGKMYIFAQEDLPYNGREIHANSGKFWFGKQTKQKCISNDGFGVCPDSPQTVMIGATGSLKKPTNLTLTPYYRRNQDPAGQLVYVAGDGSMSFLLHGDKVPDSALTYKFAPDEFAIFAITRHGHALSPSFCPTGKGTQGQIFFGNSSTGSSPKCRSIILTFGIDYPAGKYV